MIKIRAKKQKITINCIQNFKNSIIVVDEVLYNRIKVYYRISFTNYKKTVQNVNVKIKNAIGIEKSPKITLKMYSKNRTRNL